MTEAVTAGVLLLLLLLVGREKRGLAKDINATTSKEVGYSSSSSRHIRQQQKRDMESPPVQAFLTKPGSGAGGVSIQTHGSYLGGSVPA